jgi:hypothetical protein
MIQRRPALSFILVLAILCVPLGDEVWQAVRTQRIGVLISSLSPPWVTCR